MTRLIKRTSTLSLTREYNRRGRHPLQGIKRPHVENNHAGNVRFGVPLAAVAVIAGALSYALVERPASYQPIRPQTEVSAIALNAVDPAAGPMQPEPIYNTEGELIAKMDVRPPSNRKLITVNDLQDSEIMDLDAAAIEEIYDDSKITADVPSTGVIGKIDMDDGYYSESGATTVPTAPENVARKYVTVEKNATATDYAAMMASADRALKAGNYDSAMEMFESLRKKNPRDVRALMGLAVAQQRYGLAEAAQHTYETVLGIDGNNAEATVNMLGLMQTARPEEAYRKLSSLWSKSPQSPGIAAQLGLVSAQLGHTEEAMKYVGIAASLEPDNASHLYNMAVITDRKGGRGRAVELYEKALEVDAMHGGSKSVPRDLIYDRLSYLRRL
jgi:Flp pilus assembly protein TadD